MRKFGTHRSFRLIVALGLILSIGFVDSVSAQMSSSHYQVNEAQFGSGANDMCNAGNTMCAKTSAGDLTVGTGASSNYSAQFGFNTTDEPLLEVSVNQVSQNMGVLTTSTTGTASATVSVRSYLSRGYVMQITGQTPKNSNKYISGMSTAAASQQGTEQFGMNLVDNATPNIGANPTQVPSGSFSFGAAATGYNTADQYKYVDGDVVAQSTTSTGQTDYTISMIMNISDTTPGGKYTGSYSAVVVPVY